MTLSPRLRNWIAALLAGLWLIHAAFALDPAKTVSQYVHSAWTAERGLLGGPIYAICQSSDGYLWIGTQRGLVRFDGTHFTLIQQPLPDYPSLGPVLGLVSDIQGNMWIRLEGPRLLLYRNGQFEDAFAHFHLKGRTYTAMSSDYEGRLFVTDVGNRVFRYRDGKFPGVKNTSEVWDHVISMAETRDHHIWLGTRDSGLYRMTDGHPVNVSSELADKKINSLLPANSGGMWIGTDNGLLYWDGSGLAHIPLPAPLQHLQILAMIKDHDANTWVGTNRGLVRITPSGAVSLDLLSNGSENAVTAIYEDLDEAIWFGGSQGLQRLQDGMFTSYSTKQDLPSDSNGPVYVDSAGRTWFAPLSGGLYWMKDGQIRQITASGLVNDVVYSISGGGGEVWVGRQRGGLTVLTRSGTSFDARTYTQADGLAQNSVYSVHRDTDGTVWAGTVSAGVSRLRNGVFANYSVADGLSSGTINSIAEGQDGTIWFATPSGLDSFSGGHWRHRGILSGLPSSNVNLIFEDSKHTLWIATSQGLAFLSSGNIVIPPHLPEPLHEYIYGIAEDSLGSLWFVTSDHVLQVNRNQLLKGGHAASSVLSYGISDGLLSVEGVRRERSVVADTSGRIWLSLSRGLSVANPGLTIASSVPVMARISAISVDGSPVDLRSSPEIAPDVRSIAFDYSGTNLSSGYRVRFRYRLQGFDRDWSHPVTSHQVIYTNLGPGSYRFRIVASNASGLWNGQEADISFIVERAFWQTWWFQTMCAVLIVLILFALYWLRLRQLSRRLDVRFQERLAERTKIARDLHDTLLQGFLGALMQIDVAEDQLPEDSPAKPVLKRVLDLMGRSMEEGRNAIQSLRVSDSKDHNLEVAFSRMKREFGANKPIDYKVIADSVPRRLRPLIRDEVYRIGREAVANAFRHAHASAVEVEVEYASRHLRLLIRDDGCGIDSQIMNSGRNGHWGLAGMRERSENIGASLRLRSRLGAGTEVELTVPAASAFEDKMQRSKSRWLAWLNREKFESGDHIEKRQGR